MSGGKNKTSQPSLRAQKRSRKSKRESASRFWDQPAHIQKRPGRIHTTAVKLMRYILPLAALAIVVAVMAWPQIEKSTTGLEPKEPTVPKTVQRNELLNPRFESEDKRQQPFTILADRAVQSLNNPDAIELESPKAELALKDGAQLYGAAKSGRYIQKREQLLLEGDVTLRHDAGYEMRTEEILLSLEKQTAFSDTRVEGEGPAGRLTATGLSGNAADQVLIFTGPATLILYEGITGF